MSISIEDCRSTSILCASSTLRNVEQRCVSLQHYGMKKKRQKVLIDKERQIIVEGLEVFIAAGCVLLLLAL
jgi:hypothetical protein